MVMVLFSKWLKRKYEEPGMWQLTNEQDGRLGKGQELLIGVTESLVFLCRRLSFYSPVVISRPDFENNAILEPR